MRFQATLKEQPDGSWKVTLEGAHETAYDADGPALTYMTTTAGATRQEALNAAIEWARQEATGERDY